MRHGKTNYTGTFPDLTDEGTHQVRTEGLEQVRRWMAEHSIAPEMLSIVSSPAPRAHGTASIIKDGIGHTREIILTHEIEPLRWKKPERCAEVIREMSGYINLESEPRFADSSLFEPLHEVHKRWSTYITSSVEKAMRTEVSANQILVAHYETFCGIVSSLFGIPPVKESELQHVEGIELRIFRDSDAQYVVQGSFRGKTALGTIKNDGVWEPSKYLHLPEHHLPA